MADRYPLVVNTSTGRIAELPAGDNLDLSGSNIANVGNVNVTGKVTATGNVEGSYFIGNGSQLTGITTSPAGTNGQLQYNNNGSFAGATGVTFNAGNLALGSVANVKMTGGTSGQVVVTDGAGNLSFSSIQADSFALRPVRVATNANITLSGAQTIDGIVVGAGDRVLVWRQSTTTQNGIYVVQTGSWTRATDFDTGAATLLGGVLVTVTAGTQFAGVTFTCTNTTAITVGTTGITFQRSVNSGFISIWTADGAFQDRATGATSSGATSIGVGAVASTDATAYGYTANAQTGAASFGYGATAGSAGTALGRSATAGQNSTAVGQSASAAGSQAVAIGRGSSASASNATALGDATIIGAGGLNSIAIGAGARTSSANAISIGAFAGVTNQGAGAIALGRGAAALNQGANAIAIGFLAGTSNQAANTIIINATGVALEDTTPDSFIVKPVRNASGTSALYYDATSGEITYSTISGSPAGSNTQIQFNNAGSLGASANLTFNNTTNTLSATNIVGTTMTVDGLDVGTKIVPQVSQSANYTLVASDSGKHILHPSADTTARTFTIPANSAVAYPVGTTITFVNQNGAGNVTISITSDTMRLAGAGTTGSRTLAANGVATAIKIATTEWIISGVGLT